MKIVVPPDVHEPILPYAHAVITGQTVYFSAQLPLDRDGKLVGEGDVAAQAEQVFQNVKAVLAAAGASLNQVVKLTTYIKKFEDRPAIMEVRNRYFGQHRAPSIIAVVRDLPVEGALLEVDGIAVLE